MPRDKEIEAPQSPNQDKYNVTTGGVHATKNGGPFCEGGSFTFRDAPYYVLVIVQQKELGVLNALGDIGVRRVIAEGNRDKLVEAGIDLSRFGDG